MCVLYKIARTFIHSTSPLRIPPYRARACTHTQTLSLVYLPPHALTHTHRGPGAGYCNAVTRKTGQKYLRIFRRCSCAHGHRTLRDSRGRAGHHLAVGAAVSGHTGLFPSPQPTSPTDLKFPADELEGGRAMGCCVQQRLLCSAEILPAPVTLNYARAGHRGPVKHPPHQLWRRGRGGGGGLFKPGTCTPSGYLGVGVRERERREIERHH